MWGFGGFNNQKPKHLVIGRIQWDRKFREKRKLGLKTKGLNKMKEVSGVSSTALAQSPSRNNTGMYSLNPKLETPNSKPWTLNPKASMLGAAASTSEITRFSCRVGFFGGLGELLSAMKRMITGNLEKQGSMSFPKLRTQPLKPEPYTLNLIYCPRRQDDP